MKKLRIVSILICMSLLLSITSPLAYATETDEATSIIVDESFALYQFENHEYSFTIYINTETSGGSFAVIFKSNPDYLYDYFFTFDNNVVDTSSTTFWNNLASECFTQSSQWVTIYIPTAITQQNDHSRATPENYFDEWLYNKYGSEHTASVIGYYMRQSQLFVVKEDLSFHVGISATYTVSYAISVAGFVTAFLGYNAKHPVVSLIGVIAGVGGMIAAGTQIKEYVLSINYLRCAYVQGGTILHAYASKIMHYTGYGNPDTGYAGVDEGSMISSHSPSIEQFEDLNILVDAAWDHLRNP